MNLFYADPADIRRPHLRIKGQEAKHISKVMRMGVSDLIFVTDGLGCRFECKISSVSNNVIEALILESINEKRCLPYLTACIGSLKKRDRLEFAIEKLTELGIDRVIVFTGEHSQKVKVRKDRLESAALAAMKQSLRLYLPEIHVEISLESALKLRKEGDKLLLADELSSSNSGYNRMFPNCQSIFVIIGPEGGLSVNERKRLSDMGAESLNLGKKRLRTETAAIVAADRLKNLIGRDES